MPDDRVPAPPHAARVDDAPVLRAVNATPRTLKPEIQALRGAAVMLVLRSGKTRAVVTQHEADERMATDDVVTVRRLDAMG